MHNLKHIDVNNFESDATSTTFLQQIIQTNAKITFLPQQ